jgi:hypothetical protein
MTTSDPTLSPAGRHDELMASLVITISAGIVEWPVHQLRPDDEVRLTGELPHVRIVDIADHVLPALVIVELDLVTPGSDQRCELVLPRDTWCTVILAMRDVSPPCLQCGRPCLYVFDAARDRAPHTVLCVDCDQATTDEVMASRTDSNSAAGSGTNQEGSG